MKPCVFTGSAVAIVTPFCGDGVDLEAFDRLIERQIQGGTDAIVVCGTTGEAATLSYNERMALIERCVRAVDRRVPVIAGSGTNSTASSIALSKAAQSAGVDALLTVTPYYNKASQSGLVQHFSAIADAVDIPVILYNVPSRTGVGCTAQTYQLAQHIHRPLYTFHVFVYKFGKRTVCFGEFVSWILRAEPKPVHYGNE